MLKPLPGKLKEFNFMEICSDIFVTFRVKHFRGNITVIFSIDTIFFFNTFFLKALTGLRAHASTTTVVDSQRKIYSRRGKARKRLSLLVRNIFYILYLKTTSVFWFYHKHQEFFPLYQRWTSSEIVFN